MPSWNDLLTELESKSTPEEKTEWHNSQLRNALGGISERRDSRNVISYSSAFLQKPNTPPGSLQITLEDVNGFMSVLYGMDCSKGLTLILHTPGGSTNAVESIVDYLWSKFDYIEVIVPTFAMSAGTMISLASDLIIMGRHSQLGPIDPQMPYAGRYVSARAIVDQFNLAKDEIVTNNRLSSAWYPILQSLGPSLIQEAKNALDYGERMVAKWLEAKMLKADPNKAQNSERIAKYFSDATEHKDHGRRINRDEAKVQGINICELESDQELQEHVLTLYHLMTILFEKTPSTKILSSNYERNWVKTFTPKTR